MILLSAAIRDLHQCYPNRFITDVRTPFPQLWENSPYVTPLDERDAEIQIIDCHYPLINSSNRVPYHAIHGFIEFLNERLSLNIKPSVFKGDIHLSDEEKSWDSQVHEIIGKDIPFWIVVAGGKNDVTIKWWDRERYQQVVDHFRGKIQFVQVGAKEHNHPRLDGVIDLRGQTDLRQLVRLMYHAQGVLCPVTLAMHLAAAVEVKGGIPKNRPCVVVAGGREPAHWEAYPHHQYIHTGGALLCCDNGGCWKSRVVPLGDGDERDRPENLCVDVVGKLPRCMDAITAAEVIRRVETYFEGGACRFLTRAEAHATKAVISKGERIGWRKEALEIQLFRRSGEKFIETIPAYPGNCHGRGIVICGGGIKYFPNAWVCINMLRRLGCNLPIQLWYLGDQEIDETMKSLVKPLKVECVDALKVREKHPTRILNGYELKPYSIIQSPFQEVLFLDADNVPVVNPEFLFQTHQFKKAGAIFWPDYGRLTRSRNIWRICGVPFRDEPEFESGQIVVDKKRCWKALRLAMWYNEHSDYFYHHIHGDKDTFHMAFRKLEKSYAMPATLIHTLHGTMCQHDFKGRRIFQHRNRVKWHLGHGNPTVRGFLFEAECFEFLEELKKRWSGNIQTQPEAPPQHVVDIGPARLVPSGANRRAVRSNASVSQKRVVFRGPINGFTGYGLHSSQIIYDLGKMGYEVKVRSTELDERFAPIPSHVRNKFVNGVQPEEWELLLHPPNIAITPNKRTLFFTMWEASRLPREWVGWLNAAECLVVPCQWNATCFSAAGVDRPIRIVPLGIKTNIFKYVPPSLDGPCVFGAAGKIQGGGQRKGLDEVIELFQRAFPSETDVRLRVKCFPDCGVKEVGDPRVEITAAYLSEKEMARWYASLTCFVSISRSEGWGLMPHQAMAVGRPCIAVRFGGHAEFFNETHGYSADFKLVPASYNYSGGGVWAEPDKDHLIELLRRVYKDRDEARRIGVTAARFASTFTWARSTAALVKVMREVGVISE